MSVYTTVDAEQLSQFLKRYELGKALDFKPIAAGITNTNYYLDTEQGGFVLTLYEHHSDDEIEYMLKLQLHLADRSVCCSQPVRDRRGDFYSSLNNRPAAIIRRLPGKVVSTPGLTQCALIGGELARIHLAGMDFGGVRANPRSLDWIAAVRDMLSDSLDEADQQAIDATLVAAQRANLEALPRGAIHADLFHDNALFSGDALGGILDFDYACSDSFAFDIAVLLNDWCIDDGYQLVGTRVNVVLGAYQRLRPLEAGETDALPIMLRISALRFWLSRLYDKAFPLSGNLTFIKCPDAFRQMHRLRSTELSVPSLPHPVPRTS
ncbi:MAG: homoserine kinase [Gammaproteobacteria bacterium]|nr:homoserine kinase [Gammaproteobacteria bacterium]